MNEKYIPDEKTTQSVLDFIYNTHFIENVKLTYQDVLSTSQGTKKNPFAAGHIVAFHYIWNNLLGQKNFPSEDYTKITNTFQSDENLKWLKELHKIVLNPIIKHPQAAEDRKSVV